jgi:hypothetical protein
VAPGRPHHDLIAPPVHAQHPVRIGAGAGRQIRHARVEIVAVAPTHQPATESRLRTAEAGMSTQSGRCAIS